MRLPDDTALTEAGLAPSARGRVLLIACGALAHEVLAIKRSGGWNHLDLQCLPANLHLWPDRIPAAVEKAVGDAKGYEKVNAISFRIGDYEAVKEASVDPYEAVRDGYLRNRFKKMND